MESRIFLLSKVGFIFRWLSLIAPCLVVLGWLIHNDGLKRLVIGTDAMNPMAAFLSALIALSILLQQTTLVQKFRWFLIIYGFAFVFSVTCLFQFIFKLPIRIDHLFFGKIFSQANDGVNPMAPASSIVFILIGLVETFWFFDRKRVSEGLLVVAFTLTIFLLTGYAFRVPEFHSSIKLFPALQTCLLFLILILAIAFSKPNQGIVGLLTMDLEGSRIGRVFIIFTFIIPITIAYLRMLAQWHNLITTEMGVAIVMSGYIFIFGTGLLITVASLNKRDQQRKDDALKIAELNEELKSINNKQHELIKELATANEELQASGENLRATNDELVATNEKLEEAMIAIKMQDEIIITQKEEALRRSQEYIEIIFSNTEEEILLLDYNGKVLMFNQSLARFMEKATGRRPQVGTYVWEMTVPERAGDSKRLFSRALAGEIVMEEAAIHINSKTVVHLLKYEPVWVDREIKYITVISIDITHQKQASSQLQERVDQLQKANYELDRFVYSVSHDLRAPLSSILGLVNVAEMENNSSETPYLNMIRGRINTLDNFIKNILDYSRNSRTEIQLEEIDFESLIETTKDSLRTMNDFASIDIRLKIQQATPFYSDAIRITTIFSNLLSNAVRFRDFHKAESFLEISITTLKNNARILVKDNGIGIANEHLSKVFNMFYRATDHAVGSGIGLYLVKETVLKLGGTIKLKSELGVFTEFEILLPNRKVTSTTKAISN